MTRGYCARIHAVRALKPGRTISIVGTRERTNMGTYRILYCCIVPIAFYES